MLRGEVVVSFIARWRPEGRVDRGLRLRCWRGISGRMGREPDLDGDVGFEQRVTVTPYTLPYLTLPYLSMYDDDVRWNLVLQSRQSQSWSHQSLYLR
jgi:hypothetical protein